MTKSKPAMHVETVTPQQAEKWLSANHQNRSIKMSLVRRFAREMKAHRWMFDGSPLRFDNKGNLIDGQHRLHACILADTPFETAIWTGLPPEVFQVVDRGRLRSLGDTFDLLGEIHYYQLAAAVNLQWQYENNVLSHTGPLTYPEMTEAISILEKNPGLREGLPTAYRLRQLTSAGMMTFLYYQFSIRDSKTTVWFFDRLCDGCDLEPSMPVHLLRERLIKNRLAPITKLTRRAITALVIKAWNATYAQQSIKALTWQTGGKFPEPFPVIKPQIEGGKT